MFAIHNFCYQNLKLSVVILKILKLKFRYLIMLIFNIYTIPKQKHADGLKYHNLKTKTDIMIKKYYFYTS